MKNKKKYIYSIITLTLISIGIFIGLTSASFSSKDVVTNKLQVGEILTQIIEKDENKDDYKDKNVTTKNEEIIKEVYVKNPSRTDSLVRVSISTRWVDPNNAARVLPIKDGDVALNIEEGIDNNINSNLNWYKGNDGYYYYKKILKGSGDIDGKDITDILLKSVKFNGDISSYYSDMEFKVDVKVEAVETTRIKNNDGSLEYKYNYMWSNIKDSNLHVLLKALVDSQYDEE